MPTPVGTRDPLSEWFDVAARRLIRRAYANRGVWTGVYLAPPTPLQRAHAARLGIYNLYERDRWGEQRWVRAYKRAVYYQLKKHGWADVPRWDETRISAWPAVALEWQTGQRVIRSNWPARRWAIRVRLHDGGSAAATAARAKPAGEQWVGTSRQSGPDDHDW
jgi:hypothetical protein